MAAGAIAEEALQMGSTWLLVGAGLALGAGILAHSLRRRWTGWILLVGVACLAGARFTVTTVERTALADRAPWLREVVGEVTDYPALSEGHTSFRLLVDPVGEPIRVTVFHAGACPGWIHCGDRVAIRGRFEVPRVTAADEFDYEAYLRRRGMQVTASVSDPEDVRILEAGTGAGAAGDRLRQRLVVRLLERLPGTPGAAAAALLFGERGLLGDEVEDAFRASGITHLLATSGLHLGIALAGLWWIVRRAGARPAVAYPVVAVAAGACLWIVGPRVSLVRAVTMLAFVALGSVLADLGLILRRWIEPLQGLAAAAILVLAMRPGAVLDAGFQLSFAATAGILIAVKSFAEDARADGPCRSGVMRALRRRLRETALVSMVAHVATAPLVAAHFGSYHVLGILANLAMVPLVAASLWVGLLVLLLPAPLAARAVARALSGLLEGLIRGASGLAGVPGAELACGRPLACWLAGLSAYLLGAFAVRSSSWTRNAMSIAALSSPARRRGGGRRSTWKTSSATPVASVTGPGSTSNTAARKSAPCRRRIRPIPDGRASDASTTWRTLRAWRRRIVMPRSAVTNTMPTDNAPPATCPMTTRR